MVILGWSFWFPFFFFLKQKKTNKFGLAKLGGRVDVVRQNPPNRNRNQKKTILAMATLANHHHHQEREKKKDA